MKRIPLMLAVAIACTSLVSCASAQREATGLSIVASTDVYGSIASAVAGSAASVTSIIDSPSQDPHDFEASPRAQLALSRADIVIVNGGGYDDFMDALLSGDENPEATVLRVVELSPRTDVQIAANEHVWYDLDTVRALVRALEGALTAHDPSRGGEFEANAKQYETRLDSLKDRVGTISAEHSGESVLVTEPVPLYLLEDAGLRNRTPASFSAAVEAGRGVPPAALAEMLDLLASGDIMMLADNEQTQGRETAQLRAAAQQHGVPVVEVTETLPADRDYVQWMGSTISEIEEALS